MSLNIIGLGLADEKDITLKGLEIIKQSDYIYLENYTSILLNTTKEKLEKLYNKQITLATRVMVEGDSNEIINHAKTKTVSLLVVGDPFSATTHIDLYLRAKKENINVNIVHNASILTAIGSTGLQLYKFGKTTSIVFKEDNWLPETPYDVIKQNKVSGLHTLCLLDIKISEPTKEALKQQKQATQQPRFMTINEALSILLEIENKRKESIITKKTRVVACARLGAEDQQIAAGTVEYLIKTDFGKPLHSLIIPSELHFMEEEALKMWEV